MSASALPRPRAAIARALALVALLGLPSLATAVSLPDWDEGTTWTIKSVYRKIPPAYKAVKPPPSPSPTEGWTEPTFWVFRVSKVKKQAKGTFFLIQVKNKDGSRANEASLIVARYRLHEGEPETILLWSGKFYEVQRDQPITVARKYVKAGDPGRPVMADDSIIPYDFPVFPLLEPAAGKPASKHAFEITEEVDGLRYARDIVETDGIDTPLEKFAGVPLAEYLAARKLPSTGLAQVELTRAFDGSRVHQVWADKAPYFLYSENGVSRSWLWEWSRGKKPSGGKDGKDSQKDKD